MDARNLVEPDPPSSTTSRSRWLARASLLGLLLMFPLSAGGGALAGGEGAPGLTLVELAGSGAPSGFQLQEVSVASGQEAGEEVVSASYLGPGVRNEIEYATFASDEAADSFLAGLEADACSVRARAVCSARVGNVVVSGASSSNCPHPTPGVRDRAESLLSFGIEQLGR